MQGTHSCAHQIRSRSTNKSVQVFYHCYVNVWLIKKIQDEKDQIASISVNPYGRWGDFFEGALLDKIEDKREQAEREWVGGLYYRR
jgi:hypothetical protein